MAFCVLSFGVSNFHRVRATQKSSLHRFWQSSIPLEGKLGASRLPRHRAHRPHCSWQVQPFSAHALAQHAIIVEHNASDYYYPLRLTSEYGGTQNWVVTISLVFDTLLRGGFS